MIEPRAYQREAIDAVHAAHRRGVMRPAVGLPTGTGKTIVFSQLAEERRDDGRALILAHRDELLRQAATKYQEVAGGGADIGFVQAGQNDVDHQVVIASVQSLSQQRRLDQFPFDEIATTVIDEAHHAVADSYMRIVERIRDDSLLLGVSATLERGDKVGLGAVWQEVVYLKTLKEMILAGYLVDIRALAVRLPYNMGQLKTNRGDFVASDVEGMLDATKAYSVAANAYLEHAAGRKTIIFTPTVNAAHAMASTFTAAGVTAEAVDGRMPIEERRAILDRFATGETTVVSNALVLTEGFDEPGVECIIIARPTKSRPMYVQMIGRGTRLYPGKQDLLVLDLMGNTDRVDLQTLPKLFGLKIGDIEREGAVRVAGRASATAGLYDRNAGVVAGEVDLFERKDVNWLRLVDGRWLLTLGNDGDVFLEPTDGKWNAIRRYWNADDRVEGAVVLGADLDIGYAMGVAEEYMRTEANATHLTDKSAPWRAEPVSPKQEKILGDHGIPVPLTKGEASDLISAAFAKRRRVAV